MPKANFFVVGAPKCGTTSVYGMLRQHPDVFMPSVKEPHYFSTDIVWKYREVDLPDESAYAALFAGAETQRAIGEASVWYLHSSVAAENIRRYNPEARILCILRDPIAMMQSLHRFAVANGSEDLTSFRDALAAEPDRRAGRRIPATLFQRSALFYREVASFDVQLARYYSTFPARQIRVLLFDDLRRDAAAVAREVFEFLGVSPDVAVDASARNVTAELRYGVANWLGRRAPRATARLRAALGPRQRAFLRQGLSLVGGGSRSRADDLPPDLRQELVEYFRPDVERLSDRIGRDLRHWLRPAPG